MSTRLQIVMDAAEVRAIRRIARRNGLTASEWARQALRAARRAEPIKTPARKLAAIREASRHAGPTADVGDLLADIARGRSQGLP
jgi:transposase-like protein